MIVEIWFWIGCVEPVNADREPRRLHHMQACNVPGRHFGPSPEAPNGSAFIRPSFHFRTAASAKNAQLKSSKILTRVIFCTDLHSNNRPLMGFAL